VVLVAAGYAFAGAPALEPFGWAAAMLAVLTAYVRALAGSLGAAQDFGGPMAKQRRMEVMSLACLLVAALTGRPAQGWIMAAALVIIAAGSVVTAARRARHLVRELESR